MALDCLHLTNYVEEAQWFLWGQSWLCFVEELGEQVVGNVSLHSSHAWLIFGVLSTVDKGQSYYQTEIFEDSFSVGAFVLKLIGCKFVDQHI